MVLRAGRGNSTAVEFCILQKEKLIEFTHDKCPREIAEVEDPLSLDSDLIKIKNVWCPVAEYFIVEVILRNGG
jgi:hypothetical protein